MAGKNTSIPFVSPFGVANWPYLETPDTEFDEDGKYHVGVVLEDEEVARITATCDELFKKHFPEKKVKSLKYPLKELKDGRTVFYAKSGYKPKVYDAKKKPLPADKELAGGSIIRVAGKLNAYVTGANMGCTFYLYDVQFKKLVAKGAMLMDEVEDDSESDAEDASDLQDNDLDI